MTQLAGFVERLFEACQERRAQPRTQIEMPVKILVVERADDSTDPVLLNGIVHDVSVTGAMLSATERLPQQRIWLHFFDLPGPVYMEADVVRTAPPQIPLAHSYGVRFSRTIEDDKLTAWIESVRERHAGTPVTASTRGPVEVSVGDLIDVGWPS